MKKKLTIWVLAKGKDDTGEVKSSDNLSSKMETEANNSWNAEVKAGDDGNGAPSMAPTRVQCEAPFTCFSCGKQYKYKSRYDGHLRKRCGNAVGVLSSRPVPTSFHLSKKVKSKVKDPSLEEGHDGKDRYLPPSLDCHLDLSPEPGVDQAVYRCGVPFCGQTFIEEVALHDHQGEHLGCGPEDGGKVQRWRVESVLGDQVVCRTFDSKTSAERHEPHSDYLSMIQISNVMSLVTSQDEVLPMTEEAATSAGKGREPEGGSPSTGLQGKDLAPCNEARGTSKLIWRNIDKLTDKLGWRSWVQRCLRNHVRTRQKWPNTGRRRALLCGKHFDQNMAVDQHVALADSARFLYRCGSCSMSFKAWTCLCRHILRAHSGEGCYFCTPMPCGTSHRVLL